MTVSTFETCLIRLHNLGQRLIYSDFVLDRLAPKLDPANIQHIYTEDEKEQAEKLGVDLQEYAIVSRICFDFNVVQLFSLLEIHKDLITYLTTTERQKLEESLSDAWKIIEAQKTRICKWRNNHTAHGITYAPDGSFVMIPDIDPDYFQGQIELYKAAKAAIIYISGFLKNTPEYASVMEDYRKRSEKIKTMTSQPYLQINVDPILNSVKETLKKNGLDTEFRTKLTFL